MHILTSRLVSLRDHALPLPWYHRAPLGLMSGTPVHVALQAPASRPFGDLLVSVVDPAKWPFVYEVSASRRDEPGVLADVYELAPPLNLVFAEAVTVDSGSRHDARLVLEPFHHSSDKAEVGAMVEREIARLTGELERRGFEQVRARPLYTDLAELEWMEVGSIALGWVHVKGWRDALEVQAARAESAQEYECDMAVVSADTDRRLLRYVLPRKSAVSVSVEHADRPAAMDEIAHALAGKKLNILSSLLRRGSAPPYKAEVVNVVEPTDSIDAAEVEERVRGALSGLPTELRVRMDVAGPVEPEDAVLYPRRPHEIAVRPSAALEAGILAVRKSLPSGKCPIFISRRFADSSSQYNRDVVEELRQVLDEQGFTAVEALPQPGGETIVSDDVKAKIWASEAAIMFVVSTRDERQFSENLAHECGYMQGLGKPLLPLVQADVAGSVTRNANLQGLALMTFSEASAMNRRQSDSIHANVTAWLETVVIPRLAGAAP